MEGMNDCRFLCEVWCGDWYCEYLCTVFSTQATWGGQPQGLPPTEARATPTL
jgi:hypothetical protein